MSIFFPALAALMGITFVILLWVGGREAMNHQISVGTLWAIYAFLARLAWARVGLGWVTNIFQRGAASAGRLNYILTLDPDMQSEALLPGPAHSAKENGKGHALDGASGVLAASGSSIIGEVEFRDLSFAYPSNANGAQGLPVLHNIDLRIPAGSSH